MERVVLLDIGGTRFSVRASTLAAQPETMLGTMVTSLVGAARLTEEMFFDRNPRAFESILDFYRSGILRSPPDMHPDVFDQELRFWQIPFTHDTATRPPLTKRNLQEAVAFNASKRARVQSVNGSDQMSSQGDEDVSKEGAPPKEQSGASHLVVERSGAGEAAGHLAIQDNVNGMLAAMVMEAAEVEGRRRLLQTFKAALSRKVAHLTTVLHLCEEVPDLKQRIGTLERARFGPSDAMMYDAWARVVGTENLHLTSAYVYSRNDRSYLVRNEGKDVFSSYRSAMAFIKELDSDDDNDDEEDVAGDGGARAECVYEAPSACDLFLRDAAANQYPSAIRFGSELGSWWHTDYRNGGQWSGTLWELPVLHISWGSRSCCDAGSTT